MKQHLQSVINHLRESPASIREISSKTRLNWRTVLNNLEILRLSNRVEEKRNRNKRTFYLKTLKDVQEGKQKTLGML